tara:strand:+ start:351 stop:500 length:150 start_codon:yes stop_codon:yes gene_type:complete
MYELGSLHHYRSVLALMLEANSLQSAWRVEHSPARLLAQDVLRAAGPRV